MPPIRRHDREITREEALAALDAAEFGVLSMVDSQCKPYAVPISFVRDGERLIFHCAPEGRKLDCIRHQPAVTFCAVGPTEVIPSQFTTKYESVLVEGVAEIIEEKQRKIDDLMKFCEKYTPDHLAAAVKVVERSLHRTTVIEVRIVTVTGKANR